MHLQRLGLDYLLDECLVAVRDAFQELACRGEFYTGCDNSRNALRKELRCDRSYRVRESDDIASSGPMRRLADSWWISFACGH